MAVLAPLALEGLDLHHPHPSPLEAGTSTGLQSWDLLLLEDLISINEIEIGFKKFVLTEKSKSILSVVLVTSF